MEDLEDAVNASSFAGVAPGMTPTLDLLVDPELLVVGALGFAVAKAGGAFLEGYGQTLGEWFAKRTTALRALRSARMNEPRTLETRGPRVRFEAPPGQNMPDEAVLALIDLNLADLAGKTLRWDAETNAWLDIEALELSTDGT